MHLAKVDGHIAHSLRDQLMTTRILAAVLFCLMPQLSHAIYPIAAENFFRQYQADFIQGSPKFVDKYFTADATENGRQIVATYKTFFHETTDRKLEITPLNMSKEGWVKAKVAVSATSGQKTRAWSGTMDFRLEGEDGGYRIARIFRDPAPLATCELCSMDDFFRRYEADFIHGSPGFVGNYFTADATENGKLITTVYKTFFTDTKNRRLEIVPRSIDKDGWMQADVKVSAVAAEKTREWSGNINFKLEGQPGEYRVARIVYDPSPTWKVKLHMALQGADLLTTVVALGTGAVEANPVLAPLGVAGFVAIKLGAMAYVWHERNKISDRTADVANGTYAAVVASNLAVLLH